MRLHKARREYTIIKNKKVFEQAGGANVCARNKKRAVIFLLKYLGILMKEVSLVIHYSKDD